LIRPDGYVTLDRATSRAGAAADPDGFVAGLPPSVALDEVQRVPDLLLAIKAAVDDDRRAGRFLLTGSANVLMLPDVADALPGRMQIVELGSLTQGEIHGDSDGFVDAVFSSAPLSPLPPGSARTDVVSRVLCGGFPEVVSRDLDRQEDWFESYLTAVVEREVRDLSAVGNVAELFTVIRLIAARSGGLFNLADVARGAQLAHATARRYLALRRAVFLVTEVPAWSTSLTTRIVKSPKLFLCDSGLTAHLLGVAAERLVEQPHLMGPLFEVLVVNELHRQLGWSRTRPLLTHLRTPKGQRSISCWRRATAPSSASRSRRHRRCATTTSPVCGCSVSWQVTGCSGGSCSTPATRPCRSGRPSRPSRCTRCGASQVFRSPELSVVVGSFPGMPSSLHEGLIEMFRQRPSLAAELLVDGLGVALPGYEQSTVEAGDFTVLTPAEYRADAVVVLSAAGAAVWAVVVEVQLRADPGKRWSWPIYLSTLRGRFRCPTVLLVVCVDAATASWCAVPIELGPGTIMTPMVVGPDRVPVVTDVDHAARVPELAVLSALAHGADPNRSTVLDALLSALATVDAPCAELYCDLVLAALPEAAQRYLEDLMATGTYEYQSDFARRYFSQGKAEGEAAGKAEGEARGKAEGKAEGKATAVLAVLHARGIDVPTGIRTRIAECSDLDRLDIWVRRAATADTVHDLFD